MQTHTVRPFREIMSLVFSKVVWIANVFGSFALRSHNIEVFFLERVMICNFLKRKKKLTIVASHPLSKKDLILIGLQQNQRVGRTRNFDLGMVNSS